MVSPSAAALTFDWDYFGGIQGTLNTSIGIGAQLRIQDRDPDLIGIANLNPTVCRSICQPHSSTEQGDIPGRIQLGLEAEGDAVNQAGLDAPGGGSLNNDDGNLNFNKYDITQAPIQITQDLELVFSDFAFVSNPKFFVRYNAFHDFINYNRSIYKPNFYTPEDRARDDARRNSGDFGFPSEGTPSYEPADDKYNEFLGQDIDLLDFYVQGEVPVPFLDSFAQITVGEQIINWGESTLLSVNSLNTINPINVNALFRPAFLSLATVFSPIGAARISMPLTRNTSFEAFYQYDWEKVEIPPRGGFLSFIDVTLDEDVNVVNPGFGQAPDDPDENLRAEQQLLTAIAEVTGRVEVREEDAPAGGQYGFAFTWYLPSFNNGTELRFYHANYHSRLPYASFFAGNESCLQSAPTGDTVTDTANLLADCPNADVAHFLGAVGESTGGAAGGLALTLLGEAINGANVDQITNSTQANGEPCPADAAPGTGPCAEGYDLDSISGLLEYPEDIKLFGMSFNTSFGGISVQGEVAYRPNLPLQVDDIDLAFAALQPSAPVGCANGAFSQNRSAECEIATFADRFEIGLPAITDLLDTLGNGGDAVGALGNLLGVDVAAASDILDTLTTSLAGAGLDLGDLAGGLAGIPDNVLLSDPPGRRNAFPDYVTAYRGGEPGNIAPGEYIQGYERFQVLQYNLGATYVIGPGNWIRSNQIILLFEVGANQVLGFPEFDELQIEGDGTFYHASVGTDGSGAPACPADGPNDEPLQGTSEQTSGNTRLCGQFQARFNPRQQTSGFATSFSAGSRIIAIIRYENVFPGISFEPLIVLAYDFAGTSPGPGPNFIEGRQIYVFNVEMRYRQHWSLTTGFTFFRGAEPFNLLTDRDFFQIGVRYRF